eukprot:242833_1
MSCFETKDNRDETGSSNSLNTLNSIVNMATVNCLKPSYKKSQIMDWIQNAQCFEDLISASNELLCLDEIKSLLFQKLDTDDTNSVDSNPNPNHRNPPLNHLYFKIIPLDRILSDDILCSIIQYLSCNSMYNTLFLINKHFNELMRSYGSSLYQSYQIKLKYCCKLSALYLNVSHNTRCIHVSHFMENQYYVPIQSLQDIETHCPFFWFCTKRLTIIPTTIFSTKCFTESSINNTGIREILQKIVSNAKSLHIDDEYEDDHSDKSWMNLVSLDSVFHIHSISKDLIYSNVLNSNLLYLDLTGRKSNGIHILSHALQRLDGLLALRIDIYNTLGMLDNEAYSVITFPKNIEFLQIENFNYYSTYHTLDLSQCKQIIAVCFKENKRRKYVLNMETNPFSIAMDLYHKRSNTTPKHGNEEQQELLSVCECVRWPMDDYHVECLLFDHSKRAQSARSLYKYFDSFKIKLHAESNARNIPVKYIRYVRDLFVTQCDRYAYGHSSSIDIISRNKNKPVNCVVLDGNNNDGLLYKLLIMDKYKALKDTTFVQDRIAMYNEWFAADIAKW